ncbi:MAG: hypothetical protein IT233_06240 [Bacteroidia bacterium]|nr:hypothetical protein [Bacteroidia bacterium]
MRSLLPGILAFCISLHLSAGYHFDRKEAAAMGEIMNLHFRKASELIGDGKQKDPTNRVWLLLENYIDFLSCAIGEDRYHFIQAERNGRERLKQFSAGEDKLSPWPLHCKAETLLQWAFARMKFGEHLTAAKEIAKAYKLLEQNLKNFPGFLPSRKSMGLLRCLLGSMPEKYRWITELKGLQGNVSEGYRELCEVLERADTDSVYAWLQEETLFYLSFISLNLYPDDAFREEIIRKWEGRSGNTPLGIYACASLLIRSGSSREALPLLNSYSPGKEDFSFHYLGYLKGLCLLYKNDTLCRKHFRDYLEHFNGHTFRRSALHKLAWSYLVNGDTSGYSRYMNKLTATGSTIVDEDRQATREHSTGEIPHPVLLLARLYFDGGFYKEARKALLAIVPSRDLPQRLHRMEAVYRLARIQEKMGEISKAMDSYDWVIQQTVPSDQGYFAPNSALMLGLLWESQGNKKMAAYYYRKCLSYSDHQYKQSLDQKAQAGLSRVK